MSHTLTSFKFCWLLIRLLCYPNAAQGEFPHRIPVLKYLNVISKRKGDLPSQGARDMLEFLSVGG